VGSVSRTELIVLADATPEIGAGHAMRCAALAEAWRKLRLGPMAFAGRVTIPFVLRRLRAAGAEVKSRVELAHRRRVVIADGYDRALQQRALKMPADLHVVVDDVGEAVPAGFDVIWNPNAYGDATLYPAFAGAVVAGPEAVPVRSDLPNWRGASERRIGVSLGGGALPSVLRAAVEELAATCRGWTVSAVGTWTGKVRSVAIDDPWPTLVQCDRLLVASGTTVWEAAAVGIPVALIQTADNQSRIFAWARSAGAPGISLAADGTSDLAGLLANAVMSAAKLPRIRNGAQAVARYLANLASQRPASS
jgi:UDP-2,4-diacetamido-2,4,6-trideoxy-beta-L-altropyranose hydrolase